MFLLNQMRLVRLYVLLISSLAFSSGYASETILGHTFDRCERTLTGEVTECIRNGVHWLRHGTAFSRPSQDLAKPDRWWICSSSEEEYGGYKSAKTVIDIDCYGATVRVMESYWYSQKFCEGRSDRTEGDSKNTTPINPNSLLASLFNISCKKIAKVPSQILPKKKIAQSQKTKTNETRTPEPPSWWYVNVPDYCEDFAEDERLCEEGDRGACYFAGMAYKPHRFSYSKFDKTLKKERYVIGEASYCPKITSDREKSLKYFTLSCSKGDGWGCYELGRSKYGVKDSLPYYEKGCFAEEVCGPACEKLGEIYESGDDVRQDFEKALKFFEKACDEDNAKACFRLAKMHESGHGAWIMPKVKAKHFYGKACDLGNSDGCENYKRLNQ